MKNLQTIKILGVNIDKVDKAEALSTFGCFLEGNSCSTIITLNPEMVLEAQKNRAFKEVVENGDLVFPDGIGLVYASRIIGDPLSERITGIDFTYDALKLLASKGGSAFFLGAKPGVAELAAEKLQEKISGLKIVGVLDGYFKESEESLIIDQINNSGADFLCLALGSPKQELFAAKYKDELKCKAVIGIGGSFDVWSGNIQRAPDFFIKHNIEWLYRLVKQPSRISRTIKLPLFLLKVATHKEKQ